MTDMIVTPAITGDASIYVKQSAAEGSVSFYTCTVASNGTVTKGDKYEVTVPALSTDAWTKVELPNVAAGTRLGICGDEVLLGSECRCRSEKGNVNPFVAYNDFFGRPLC